MKQSLKFAPKITILVWGAFCISLFVLLLIWHALSVFKFCAAASDHQGLLVPFYVLCTSVKILQQNTSLFWITVYEISKKLYGLKYFGADLVLNYFVDCFQWGEKLRELQLNRRTIHDFNAVKEFKLSHLENLPIRGSNEDIVKIVPDVLLRVEQCYVVVR